MSLEEEKARQEKNSSPVKQTGGAFEMLSEEDRELQQALQMSLATHDEEGQADVEMTNDDVNIV